MINRQRNIAFKLVALFFAIAFFNVSLAPDQSEQEAGKVADISVCDSMYHQADDADNFFTQVLEVGWDIYQAIPDTETTQKEEQNSKKSHTDWFYSFDPFPVACMCTDKPLHSTLFLNVDFRNYIKEVIPPPPKVLV
ncbi:hypothetical protein GCM10009122_13550 [Fulvivirga kasyanovii]|uniref:Secreted protein n=1 Tax=Fulvivirga kasyanovii TaxID=396812 RepID=A0ABW9RPE8_9BACT|nr:hypothetical protein [Fulvivirga kasyanovii]MTI25873.1 hypothetical protein [Fulvivirga kasyanovii]